MRKIIIIGAGGHGRVIADMARALGDEVMGFLDDRDRNCFSGMNILGKIAEARAFARMGTQFVIGIGDNQTRKRIAADLKGFPFATLIHPSAVVAKTARIGQGTVVMANAVISVSGEVGQHCIINTAASVDHDNTLEDYVHLSPGVCTAGNVFIGAETWLGIGSVVSSNLTICAHCVIGAGAAVVRNIVKAGTYVGVPAKKMLRERIAYEYMADESLCVIDVSR